MQESNKHWEKLSAAEKLKIKERTLMRSQRRKLQKRKRMRVNEFENTSDIERSSMNAMFISSAHSGYFHNQHETCCLFYDQSYPIQNCQVPNSPTSCASVPLSAVHTLDFNHLPFNWLHPPSECTPAPHNISMNYGEDYYDRALEEERQRIHLNNLKEIEELHELKETQSKTHLEEARTNADSNSYYNSTHCMCDYHCMHSEREGISNEATTPTSTIANSQFFKSKKRLSSEQSHFSNSQYSSFNHKTNYK